MSKPRTNAHRLAALQSEPAGSPEQAAERTPRRVILGPKSLLDRRRSTLSLSEPAQPLVIASRSPREGEQHDRDRAVDDVRLAENLL